MGVYIPGIDREPDDLADQIGAAFLMTSTLAEHLIDVLSASRRWIVIAQELGAYVSRDQHRLQLMLDALESNAVGLGWFAAGAEMGRCA